MPRQSGASHNRRPQPSSQVPAWVWLFTGAVLGAFVMFLLHLSEIKPGSSEQANNKASAPAKEEKQKPRFDFYELLKESDIPILKSTDKERTPAQKAAAKHEYILQVASFKAKDDAERLRAELLLLNLEAYTEDAKIRNGETWYRVLVGPFTSTSKMSKARSILLSNRHEALVLKRKFNED
ncbi:MAG: SPOR domain-containing protein [Agarilytica sp.]